VIINNFLASFALFHSHNSTNVYREKQPLPTEFTYRITVLSSSSSVWFGPHRVIVYANGFGRFSLLRPKDHPPSPIETDPRTVTHRNPETLHGQGCWIKRRLPPDTHKYLNGLSLFSLDADSVSLEAVPFPIEIASILYEFTIRRIFHRRFFFGRMRINTCCTTNPLFIQTNDFTARSKTRSMAKNFFSQRRC
jgi:hypothetical protein